MMAGLAAGGCAGADISSGVVGLPKSEFDRAFLAGLDVARAEHCKIPVDKGSIRSRLLEFEQAQGASESAVAKSGLAFDKTVAEYRERLAADPEACIPAKLTAKSRLAGYEKGVF